MRVFLLLFAVVTGFACFSPAERAENDTFKDTSIFPDVGISDTGDSEKSPLIFSVNPSVGDTDGGIEVTINGKNFREGVRVYFGESDARIKLFKDSFSVIVINPPHSEGKVDVMVKNPDGRYSVLKGGFEYKKEEEPVKECIRKRCEVKPTVFRYDSSKAGFSVSSVEVAAQFTNWGENRIQMNDEGINGDEVNGDGIFSVAVILPSGEYEYKFILNKNQWVNDPDNQETEPVFKNSLIRIKDGCQPEILKQYPSNGDILDKSEVRIEAEYHLNGRKVDKSGTYFIVDGKKEKAVFSEDNSVISLVKSMTEGAHWYSVVIRDMECNRYTSPSVYFIVKTEKKPPVANAGYTQITEVGSRVVLDGTLSRDFYQTGIDEYKWEVVSSPENVVLSDEYATDPQGYNNDPNAIPQKERSLVSFIPQKEGYYRFSLKVLNSDGESASDETDVYVLNKSGNSLRPLIKADIRFDGKDVVIDASDSLGANSMNLKYYWFEDIRNVEHFGLQEGSSQRITVKKDGAYFFYLVANDGTSNSEVKKFFVYKKGGLIRAQDFSHASEWFKNSNVYEIFVRKFMDGDGDGLGDLKGLKEKILYLKELGVDTIWLMPVFRSNDKDHGYHTTDYYTIEPDYGDNDDLLYLIQEAHRNGIRIILDMVINHTSRRHPFFIEALNMNPFFRDFYIWFENSSTNLYDKYGYGREMGGSRLTLETGWAEIPDINYSNPVLRQYIYDMLNFWMDPNGDGDFSDGVDGFRIDPVSYTHL
ncbi:MAG: alpha-amylase family glycosyl hydrolase, partial [Deltaproteobacteria bacterium]|nr:alpha-amylase family glycosyl hydrolase [Deltaproteobacteria bacterium]